MTDPAPAERLAILNSVLYIQEGGFSRRDESVYGWAEPLSSNPQQLEQVIAKKPAEMSGAEIRGLLDSIKADRGTYDRMVVKDVTTSLGSPKFPDDSRVTSATIDFDGQPIVLFKGTGGEAEWRDNGMGGYANVTDTPSQQEALEYFNKQMKDFPGRRAIVSGHSKGGNKSQYVGLLGGDQVDSVYSFDGQGFNQAFQLKYADEIARNASRIASISNEHDYVNTLFNAVPGSDQYYIGAPWLNTFNPLESAKRWHSPATMLTPIGDRYVLNLDSRRRKPDPAMAEVDDFVAFAQKFMTKDDFAYVCYFAMSKMMKHPKEYGKPIPKPDGFEGRFLSLLRNYLDLNGVDPQDIVVGMGALGAFAGAITGYPLGGPVGGAVGATIGAAEGAALGVVLAMTPSAGYTTVPRDFRIEVKQRLLALVADVEAEPWWDVTNWDVWYRIDHVVLGGVDFAKDESRRREYYRKMIDMHGTTREQIERIFTEVGQADQDFAVKARHWTSKQNDAWSGYEL